MSKSSRRRNRSQRYVGRALLAVLATGGLAVAAAGPSSAATTGLSFASPATYAIGGGVSADAVAVGDLNGDGHLDLAVAGQPASAVSVLLGTDDGTFTLATVQAVVGYPDAVAVGDLNGDGDLDLAVANAGADTVSVLLGNGHGAFQQDPTSFRVGDYPSSVAVADLNGDGDLDLAVSNFYSRTVSVLLGNGHGTFQQDPTPLQVGDYPSSVAVADLNGDSHPDLAVATAGDGTVSVLLGNGDGTFQGDPTPLKVGDYPMSVAVADLNGDDHPDLVVANRDGGTVSVLLGNADGTFQGPTTDAAGSNPLSVVVGDLDGDGNPDLVVANNVENGRVSVLLGNGDGTFQPRMPYDVVGDYYLGDAYTMSVAVGDLNGDGKPDLVVGNEFPTQPVTVLLNTTPTPATCTGGLTLSGDPATLTGAPGQSGTWTYTLTARNCSGAGLSSLKLQGGTAGWVSLDSVNAMPAQLSVVQHPKRRNTVLTGRLASLPDQATAGVAVTVTGTIDKKAECGSTVPISGSWSASAKAADGAKVSSGHIDPVMVTVVCAS